MFKIKYIIILILFTKNAFSNDIYYSEEYTIKFSSQNIQFDKQEFINSIKLDSLKKIIKSALAKDEYNKFLGLINKEFIDKFLFSIDISEETINNNNYYSNVKVAFDYSKIINFFIKNEIDYVPYDIENFLILIFDQTLYSEKTLSKDNRFYRFLINNDIKYKNLLIPNLDINDRFIVQRNDFLSKNIPKIQELISKYNNNNVLLVHAKSDINEVNITSYLYYNLDFKFIDKLTFEGEIDYEYFFQSLQKNAVEYWKIANLVDTSQQNSIKCRIKTLNLIELKKIKEIIANNNMVSNLRAIKISYNNSIYEIMYHGKLYILEKSLKKNKINLNVSNSDCNIKII